MATVGETGSFFVSLINLTSNPQRIRNGTQLGTTVLVALVQRAIAQKIESSKTEAGNDRAKYVHKMKI